ncbi:hypothetical protein [Polluticoccus soli]|uniref:hypothetical protein n=1 Tax=Polluticoccus soli TaxID=3034150 RepID=UPI0023E3326F|nr:hypothetical protein [Flavipsychrobacter sp. JY13-12]
MFYHQNARTIFVCAFFVLFAYMITGIVCMPLVQSDAIAGFLSLNNALLGKGANYYYQIDPSGMMHKRFYAWHAPGQYLVPYILGKPFNNIGYGVLLTEYTALMAGSVLYIRLLRKFHIPDVVIALSMLLIFVQRFFHGVLLVYKTADVWVFFLVPALLLSLINYHRQQNGRMGWWGYILAMVLVHSLGMFVKNSYVVFAAFAVIFFFVAEVWRQADSRQFSPKKVVYHAVPGVVFSLLLGVAYVSFYSRGDTPMIPLQVAAPPGLREANLLLYPIITVLNSPFSFNALMYRLPAVTMNELYAGAFSAKALAIGVLMVCPVLLVFYKVWRDQQFSREWKMLGFAILLFYCAAWGWFTYTHADISNEERLILPAVMVVTPMLVCQGLRNPLGGWIVGGYFVLSFIFSGTALYSLKKQYDTASVVERGEVFNHFLVSQRNGSGKEHIQLKGIIAGDRSKALLVVRTAEDFFRTGLSMPAVASGYNHYHEVEEIARNNRHFYVAEGYRRVYFLVPAKQFIPKMSRSLRVIDTKMRSYKLLCYDL